MPQGYIGGDRAQDIRDIKVDTKNNAATLSFADGHMVKFLFDPEADLNQLLYGARRRGSPDYEVQYSAWHKEHWDLLEAREQGKISEITFQEQYKAWEKNPWGPEETDPDYLELRKSLKDKKLTSSEYEEAYTALDKKKWIDK